MSSNVRSNGPYSNKRHFKQPRLMVRNSVGKSYGTRECLPLNGFIDQVLVNVEKIGVFRQDQNTGNTQNSSNDYNFNDEKYNIEQEKSTNIANSNSGGSHSRNNTMMYENFTENIHATPKKLVIDYNPESNAKHIIRNGITDNNSRYKSNVIKNFKAQQRYLNLGVKENNNIETEISRKYSLPDNSPKIYRTINEDRKDKIDLTPYKRVNQTMDKIDLDKYSSNSEQKGEISRILPSLRQFDNSFYTNKGKDKNDNRNQAKYKFLTPFGNKSGSELQLAPKKGTKTERYEQSQDKTRRGQKYDSRDTIIDKRIRSLSVNKDGFTNSYGMSTRDDINSGSSKKNSTELVLPSIAFVKARSQKDKSIEDIFERNRMANALKYAKENSEDDSYNENTRKELNDLQIIVSERSRKIQEIDPELAKEEKEIEAHKQKIIKIKDKLEYYSMDRAHKLLEIKNTNNLKNLLDTIGCRGTDTTAEKLTSVVAELEQCFDNRKQFVQKHINTTDNTCDDSDQDYFQDGMNKESVSPSRKVELPEYHEDWVEPQNWKGTLRIKDYNSDYPEEKNGEEVREKNYAKYNQTKKQMDIDVGEQNMLSDRSGANSKINSGLPSPYSTKKNNDLKSKPTCFFNDRDDDSIMDEEIFKENAHLQCKNSLKRLDTNRKKSQKKVTIVEGNNKSRSPNKKFASNSGKSLSKTTGRSLSIKKDDTIQKTPKSKNLDAIISSLKRVEKQCENLIMDVNMNDYIQYNADIKSNIKQVDVYRTAEEILDEIELNKEENDDPTYLLTKVDANNKMMDGILNDIYDNIDCSFSISLFLELKKKLKNHTSYWVPLKTTIKYFVKCLNNIEVITKNHRLRFAQLTKLIDIPFFEYHSIEDMFKIFSKCKYKELKKGEFIDYKFDKIYIQLRGKLILNYDPNDKILEDKQDGDNDSILPEALRNFRKKIETNTKMERFEDLKKQEALNKEMAEKAQEDTKFVEDFDNYRMEILEDGYITPESKLVFKKNDLKVLIAESTDVFIIDDPEIVKIIEPRYFKFDFYTKLNYFKTHQVTQNLSNGSIVNLAKKSKLIRYGFGDKIVNAIEQPNGAYFMISGKCDIAFERKTMEERAKKQAISLNQSRIANDAIEISKSLTKNGDKVDSKKESLGSVNKWHTDTNDKLENFVRELSDPNENADSDDSKTKEVEHSKKRSEMFDKNTDQSLRKKLLNKVRNRKKFDEYMHDANINFTGLERRRLKIGNIFILKFRYFIWK